MCPMINKRKNSRSILKVPTHLHRIILSRVLVILSGSAKFQLIPTGRPHFKDVPSEPPQVPSEETMRKWQKSLHKKYPEEKVVVHSILDRWIALLFKGHPVPAAHTRWERVTTKGFTIFVESLREAGLIF